MPGTPAAPTVQAAAESTTVIENELYRITFTNRGAQVKSWILKRKPDGGGNFKNADGQPLDIVHAQAAEQFGYPLSLTTYDAAMTDALRKALYVPSATGNLAAPTSLTFTWSDGSTEVRKTFSFDESYVLHADVLVTHNGAPVRALLAWPGGFGDQNEEANGVAYNGSQIDYYSNGKDEHLAPKKVSGGETLNGPFDWAGVSDPFFAAVFLPDSPATATVTTLHNQLDVAKTLHRTGFSATSAPRGRLKFPFSARRSATSADIR